MERRELLINHKKNGQIWLQNLSFLFLPVNFESGLTSLPFLLARSCNLRNYLTCSMFIQEFIPFQHLAVDTHIATDSVLYAVKPHLLFLDPVSALLHTLPPDVLHLLSPTLKPGVHTNVLRKAKLFVLLTNMVIIHNYTLLHIYRNTALINRPGSNTCCSCFLSKSSWQWLGSSSHQDEEKFLGLRKTLKKITFAL